MSPRPLPRGRASLRVEGVRVPGGRRRLERDLVRVADLAARRARRDVELTVLVVDDAEIAALHGRWLGDPTPTDVMSFPMEETPVLRGEIVASAETARREAARRGHAAADELLLYLVHGVLHLLGHDDHAPADRHRMRRAERAVLAALRRPLVYGRRPGPPPRRR